MLWAYQPTAVNEVMGFLRCSRCSGVSLVSAAQRWCCACWSVSLVIVLGCGIVVIGWQVAPSGERLGNSAVVCCSGMALIYVSCPCCSLMRPFS